MSKLLRIFLISSTLFLLTLSFPFVVSAASNAPLGSPEWFVIEGPGTIDEHYHTSSDNALMLAYSTLYVYECMPSGLNQGSVKLVIGTTSPSASLDVGDVFTYHYYYVNSDFSVLDEPFYNKYSVNYKVVNSYSVPTYSAYFSSIRSELVNTGSKVSQIFNLLGSTNTILANSYSRLKTIDDDLNSKLNVVSSQLSDVVTALNRVENAIGNIPGGSGGSVDTSSLEKLLRNYFYPTPAEIRIYNTSGDSSYLGTSAGANLQLYSYYFRESHFNNNIDFLDMLFRYPEVYNSTWIMTASTDPNVKHVNEGVAYRFQGYTTTPVAVGSRVVIKDQSGYSYTYTSQTGSTTPIVTPYNYLSQIAGKDFNISGENINIDNSGVEHRLDIANTELAAIIAELQALNFNSTIDNFDDILDDFEDVLDDVEGIKTFLVSGLALGSIFALFSNFDTSGIVAATGLINQFWAVFGAAQLVILLPLTMLVLNVLTKKEGIG